MSAPNHDKPTFLFLQTRIPDEQPARWLGRFVIQMHRPWDDFAPGFSDKWDGCLLGEPQFSPIITTENDPKYLIDSTRDEALKAKFAQVLGFTGIRDSGDKTEIEGKMIRRYMLPQHTEAFHSLQKDDELWKKVRALLRISRNGKLYMIVGAATVESAKISTVRGGSQALSTAGSLPSPTVGITNINTTLTASTSHTTRLNFSSNVSDPEIFAFEYRLIKRKIKSWAPKLEIMPVLEDVQRFEWGDRAFHKQNVNLKNKTSDKEEDVKDDSDELELVGKPLSSADVEEALGDDEEDNFNEWMSELLDGFGIIIYPCDE